MGLVRTLARKCTAGVVLGMSATVALGVAMLSPTLGAAGFIGANKLYTTDADFDRGTLFNVNHDAPGSNQLQISAQRTTLPTMWIANAGEDTVSKIDTATGRELARYRTGFGPAGQTGYVNHIGNAYAMAAPSRTAVDTDGNVYIANRRFDGRRVEVLKILASGGIDRNLNGVIDTSSDVDSNGVISVAETRPLGDLDGDNQVDVAELTDERIEWVVQVGPANGLGRSLCRDGDGNIWVGMFNSLQYYKLAPEDGALLAGPISSGSNSPYGCLVDGNGTLWGASLGSTLLELNTSTNALVNVWSHAAFGSDYGIAIGNNRVYQALSSGCSFVTFNPATDTFSSIASSCFSALGIAVDSGGNIVAGNWGSGGVAKFSPAGAVLWSAPAQPGTGEVRGVQVDAAGDVWLIHRTTANLSKYRGTNGAALGVFPIGNQPYTYSDATGISAFSTTNPLGRWTVVQDSGTAGNVWDRIAWNSEPQGSTPVGTSIEVEARTADVEANLASATFAPVTNGAALTQVGRFIEVRATLRTDDAAVTPVLSDLLVATRVTVTACDVDRDSDIDSADLLLIRQGAGQTPTASDPRDANNDGRINVADTRYCTLRCTRASCAQ